MFYALHKLKILPHVFLNLPTREKAFIIACINIRVEEEKREAEKIKSKKK